MKRFVLIFVTVVLFSMMLVATPASGYSGDGTGTIGDPYQIFDCEQLAEVNNDLVANYLVMNNLNCVPDGNDILLGDQTNLFDGDFDGGDFTITVNIDTSPFDYAGLFRRTDSNAVIHDVTIAGSVTGGYQSGGLVGRADDSTFNNVSSSASVNGGQSVGGIVGMAIGVSITDSDSSGEIAGTADYVGGLVGRMSNQSSIVDSFSTSDVTGIESVGGLGGLIGGESTVSGSHATGFIQGENAIGGFVGATSCESSFTDSYATGNVNATGSAVGGFAGYDGGECYGSTFSGVYSTGDVSGDQNVGGIIGESYYSFVEQSYSTGDVTGVYQVGGITGYGVGNFEIYGNILESFSTGTISGEDIVGGLVGGADTLLIENSYSRSTVNADLMAGGLLGYMNGEDGILRNSYSTGSVSSATVNEADDGGLVGGWDGSGVIQNAFWDTQTSGQSDSDGGVGKTTVQMKNIATFTTNLGEDNWLFGINWGLDSAFNDGYPCLLWSSESCIYTENVSDTDNDGISTETEDAAPNGGDGNGDGTPDSEQSNVSSFVNGVSGKYTTIAVPDTCTLSSVAAATEVSKSSQDATFSYPKGLVGFSADCGTPGVSITVEEYFFGAGSASDFVARKYTAYNDTYQTLDGASVTDVTVGGTAAVKLVFSLTDGGQLDNDQLANGIIVDPAGLGAIAASGTLPATGSNPASNAWFAFSLILIGCVLAFSKRNLTLYKEVKPL